MPRTVDGERPYPSKIWEQRGRPPCENSRALHISPHNTWTIINGEKSSINVNRKLSMGFLTSHQPSHVLPDFPKMAFRYPNLFFAEISTRTICYKVSLSKNFQRQSCSTINYISNGINILVRYDPVAIKFGPKGTDPQYAVCTFYVSHTACCAVSDNSTSCWIK